MASRPSLRDRPQRVIALLSVILLLGAMLPAVSAAAMNRIDECCAEPPGNEAEPQATPTSLDFKPSCEGFKWIPLEEDGEFDFALHLDEVTETALVPVCASCLWWLIKKVISKKQEPEEPLFAWKVVCSIEEYSAVGHVSGGVLRRGFLEFKAEGTFQEVPGSSCTYNGINQHGCPPGVTGETVDVPLDPIHSDPAGEPLVESVEVCWEPNLRVVNRLQEPSLPGGPVFEEAIGPFALIFNEDIECRLANVDDWTEIDPPTLDGLTGGVR